MSSSKFRNHSFGKTLPLLAGNVCLKHIHRNNTAVTKCIPSFSGGTMHFMAIPNSSCYAYVPPREDALGKCFPPSAIITANCFYQLFLLYA